MPSITQPRPTELPAPNLAALLVGNWILLTLSLAAHFVSLPPLLLQIKTQTDFV
jgi:hypothetical protein